MCFKLIKWGGITVGVLVLGAVILHATEAGSYIRSGAKSMREHVKSNVPVEFELRRARDMVDQIVPEMHANIKLIAKEEVEIDHLRDDIARSIEAIDQQKVRLAKLRRYLGSDQQTFYVGTVRYGREQVAEDTAARLEQLREAEMILESKRKMLQARERSLAGALQTLERTKRQKAMLEAKIESLAAKHRMVQAASVGSQFQVDSSKLAQTQKLIGEIQKRLDVAERVLSHEARFAGPELTDVEVIDEQDLLAQVDEYLEGDKADTTEGAAESDRLTAREGETR
jgi:hypothetical protein